MNVSRVAFGAGPVPAAMTEGDLQQQTTLVGRAIDAGVNWFDTAPGYGDGQSETNLGAALRALQATDRVHVATKVRLQPDDLVDIAGSVRRSVETSLQRLGVTSIRLLQLHNLITERRDDEPTSITPDDILGPGGVQHAMQQLRQEGLIDWIGLTGIGQAAALQQVIGSGAFDAVQAPYNLLNPSAGQPAPADFQEADYGNLFAAAQQADMGIFAIRVYAGGALVGEPPSAHTHRTKFFPLPLYWRNEARVRKLQDLLPAELDLKQAALRFTLSHPAVTSAIVGFGSAEHIDEALRFLSAGPADASLKEIVQEFSYHRIGDAESH